MASGVAFSLKSQMRPVNNTINLIDLLQLLTELYRRLTTDDSCLSLAERSNGDSVLEFSEGGWQ
jgi:hypothetical protein